MSFYIKGPDGYLEMEGPVRQRFVPTMDMATPFDAYMVADFVRLPGETIEEHDTNSLTDFFRNQNEQLSRMINELKGQLPDGMKHCTIVFHECAKGHGWLSAKNWVEHGCPTCAEEAVKARLQTLKKTGVPGVMHEVDKAFYNLTVKERDAAWMECDIARKEIKRLNLQLAAAQTKHTCSDCGALHEYKWNNGDPAFFVTESWQPPEELDQDA